jgi:hypothetical protein
MSVSIATMGKYWPQAGYGIAESKGIGGDGGGMFYEQKRKPVVAVTFRKKRKKRISVNVSLRNN